MTQAPIEPRHKDEAAKAAGFCHWSHVESRAYAMTNSNHAYISILAHAQTLADLEAARADLAEIDALLANAPDSPSVIADAKALAAPYRAIDPVAEVLKDVLIALGVGPDECVASKWNAGVAKFRAFIEGDR